ncbi:SMP-30/gluconolactonase/LRE family protein [Mesorhizobium sp. L-8-3]|uniref:SMP-30/gluconolactonase/LRE family protein n=1 Tax=Mesorhizobium sp. L-8-3 TaxID=2744522 RepID=UPI0019286512|nr:SMP-30/gluconolactonase/LRE family protein [Mesorhizobium sp. L-8-3]
MRKIAIRRIGNTRDRLGECPVWNGACGHLYWADCRAGIVRRLCVTSGSRDDFEVPAPLGSFALSDDGRAILALKDGFAVYDFTDRSMHALAPLGIDHPDVRINDGIADAAGGFVCGTMHVGRAGGDPPLGGLYRVTGDGTVTELDAGIGVANGPCFSPDGRFFYLADSAARIIWRYCRDDGGNLSDRAPFIDLADVGSAPDGATIDSEGFLWSALVHRAAIARFAPDGTLDRLIDVPPKHPTSLAFGDPKLDTLYLTSLSDSGRLLDGDESAGGLYAIEGLGVAGLAGHRVTLP